jgi:hypothetical protein
MLAKLSIKRRAGGRTGQFGRGAGGGARMAGTGGGDTSHEVTVRFVDAPAGLRTGITRADGDARLSLRTNYALKAPF